MDRRTQWHLVAWLWVIAGFAFPSLTPATNVLSAAVQQQLAATAGMSDELAYRVAFTIVRVPLTALLAMVIAATQCAVVPGVQPLRRWLTASAIAASISVLIWLPATLIAAQFVGEIFPESVRVLLLTFGAGLLAGLVSLNQRRTMRRAVFVPLSFVAMSVLAAVLGALGGWAF